MTASSAPEPVRVARHAMATRFEIVLHGANPVALRAAAEEALTEIERLEDLLSLYRTSSEIAHVNARAAREPVRLSVPVFRLIEHALSLGRETGGTFDITVGPLIRCWGFMGDSGHLPTPEELSTARARVGWQGVELDPASCSVRFAREGMMIDLGAIGKGYAVGWAGEILREAGVDSALVHGGTSSIHAVGHPPDAEAWPVAIRRPATGLPPPDGTPETPLAIVPLRDESLSVSAVWGKSFQTTDRTFGHVIDPRTGEPTRQAVLAAVALPSATETDALSTALLTLGPSGLARIRELRPQARGLVAAHTEDGLIVQSHGIDPVSC